MPGRIFLTIVVALVLSGFDRTRAAEPAPAYQWLNRSAGLPTLQAGISSIALDKVGAPVLTGFFLGTITLGTNSLTSATTNFSIYYDTFVARCDEKGDYLWVRQISGLGLNGYTSIAPDTQDDAVVFGTFVGSISLGSTELIAGGSATESEIFLANYGAAGDLLWAKSVGRFGDPGSPVHQLLMARDGAGDIYLTGQFGGSFGGSLQLGQTNLPTSGSLDVFLAKFDSSGIFLWARRAGGVSGGVATNSSRGIAIGGSGHPFITGSFSKQMDIGATNLVSAGDDDLFLARFDGDGNLLWARRAGGPGKDRATAIALDASGNALIAGEFGGTSTGRVAMFGDLSLTSSADGAGDDFVVKYDPAGNAMWARQIAGNPGQVPAGLAIDGQGNSYVLGSFQGAAAVIGIAAFFSSGPNYYVVKFRSDGSPVWAFQSLQEGFNTEGRTIGVNSSGNAYVGGRIGADLFWGKLAVDDSSSPPTILRQPAADLLVHAGGEATFSVIASGAQPTTYQWLLNGTNILGATNNSFTLTNVTSAPQGSFSVVVSNDLGVATSSNGTIVLAPPTALPDFLWAQSGGGFGWEAGTSVAVDGAGNAFVTGFYELLANFGDSWFAARGASAFHQRDMFVAKYISTGSLLWIRSGASDLEDEGRGVAVDRSGNVYVTGQAAGHSPGQPFQIGNIALTNTDRFAAKFDSNGNLLWAIPAGGSDVAVDDSGNLYLAGEVGSPPLQIGSTTLTNRGAFLAKYDSDANPLWARQIGETFLGVGRILAPAGADFVYVTGEFETSAAFEGVTLTNSSAAPSFFLAKYSVDGNFQWARQAASAFTWNGPQVAADQRGGCFWAGAFTGNLTIEGAGATSLGEVNTFLARFSPDGDLEWLRHLKGTNSVLGRSLCVDRFGNVLVAGDFTGNVSFAGGDSPTLSPLASSSSGDAFLAWYDAQGNFRGARQIASGALESVLSLAAGASGAIYLTGEFGNAPSGGGETLGLGPATVSNQGFFDFFIGQLGTFPPLLRATRTAGEIVVSWPAAATNYFLEHTSSLTPPTWNTVTNSATSDSELRSVGLPLSSGNEFYWLRPQ